MHFLPMIPIAAKVQMLEEFLFQCKRGLSLSLFRLLFLLNRALFGIEAIFYILCHPHLFPLFLPVSRQLTVCVILVPDWGRKACPVLHLQAPQPYEHWTARGRGRTSEITGIQGASCPYAGIPPAFLSQ